MASLVAQWLKKKKKKKPAYQCRQLRFNPLGRSADRNGNPLQYSFLKNPTVRGVWQATVHEVTKELDMT